MFIYSEEKNRILNWLIGLSIVYILLRVIGDINWFHILSKFELIDYETLSKVIKIFSMIIALITSVNTILIYLLFIKLRETDETMKLYRAFWWITVGLILFSYIASGGFLIMSRFLPNVFEKIRNNLQICNTFQKAYMNLFYILPIPFYIAIIVKEKLEYNWMIIGLLTNRFLMLFRMACNWFSKLLFGDIGKYTSMQFAQRFPLLSSFTYNTVLIGLASYFWILGLLVLLCIYKKKFKTQNFKITD